MRYAKEFIKVTDHNKILETIRKEHRVHKDSVRKSHEQELREADANGYARGVEHGWRDAMQKFRSMLGHERATLLDEWRKASHVREGERLAKKRRKS
jgi:hypothetical protein